MSRPHPHRRLLSRVCFLLLPTDFGSKGNNGGQKKKKKKKKKKGNENTNISSSAGQVLDKAGLFFFFPLFILQLTTSLLWETCKVNIWNYTWRFSYAYTGYLCKY